MFAIQTPFTRPILAKQVMPFYAAGVNNVEAMLSAWSASVRTTADLASSWTRLWLSTPTAFAAWRPSMVPMPESMSAPTAETAAAAAEQVQMAAADVAEAVVAAAEEMADIPLAVADETVALAESEIEPELDDLTRLVGVGPKLAAALAERGVTRFQQIAAWTDADLAEVDKALDLKGRAARDAWVAQPSA
ncbi:MAG: hypothetical protein WDM92_13880 [Caulobacteraceae bacterium]